MTLFTDDLKAKLIREVVVAMKAYEASFPAAIYGVESQTSGSQVGTGSYIRFAGRTYLLSAAHVFHEAIGDRFAHAAHSLKVGQPPVLMDHPPHVVDKPEDLGLYQVDSSQLKNVAVLDAESSFAENSTNIENDILFFHGFPGKLSRFSALANGVLSTSRPYATVLGQSTDAAFNSKVQLALAYPIDGLETEHGAPAEFIDPHGLSGSALWRAYRVIGSTVEEGWSPSKARIVGVLTGWDPDGKSLIATRIEVVRRFFGHAATGHISSTVTGT